MARATRRTKSKSRVPNRVHGRVRVYIGPSIPTVSLSYGRVFKGDLPIEIAEVVERDPWMSDLFVIPEKVAESRLALKTKGAVLRRLAERVVKMRGGNS